MIGQAGFHRKFGKYQISTWTKPHNIFPIPIPRPISGSGILRNFCFGAYHIRRILWSAKKRKILNPVIAVMNPAPERASAVSASAII
jgi:hypothetical protein